MFSWEFEQFQLPITTIFVIASSCNHGFTFMVLPFSTVGDVPTSTYNFLYLNLHFVSMF